MQADQPTISVDFRENRSKVPRLLTGFGIKVQEANLTTDYAIGESCSVERKTVNDFITSISDSRLFRQVGDLAKSSKQPLLLLEGGGLYSQGRVSANIIRGTMIWISIIKKVPVIRTFNEYDTACTLRLLAKKIGSVQKKNLEFLQQRPKIISPWQRQIKILIQISGIGLQTAKNILTTFGSLEGMQKSSDIELLGLPGLGKERVKSIRQLFPKPSTGSQIPVDNAPINGVK